MSSDKFVNLGEGGGGKFQFPRYKHQKRTNNQETKEITNLKLQIKDNFQITNKLHGDQGGSLQGLLGHLVSQRYKIL